LLTREDENSYTAPTGSQNLYAAYALLVTLAGSLIKETPTFFVLVRKMVLVSRQENSAGNAGYPSFSQSPTFPSVVNLHLIESSVHFLGSMACEPTD
jgi:hypothetical protein